MCQRIWELEARAQPVRDVISRRWPFHAWLVRKDPAEGAPYGFLSKQPRMLSQPGRRAAAG